MNELKITGTVQELLEPQSGQGKSGTWTKQEFILQTDDEKYPKSVCIEIWGDKVDPPESGDRVSASINIESREYNGRWYTNVRAWKIEVEPGLEKPKAVKSKTLTEEITESEESSDLPF